MCTYILYCIQLVSLFLALCFCNKRHPSFCEEIFTNICAIIILWYYYLMRHNTIPGPVVRTEFQAIIVEWNQERILWIYCLYLIWNRCKIMYFFRQIANKNIGRRLSSINLHLDRQSITRGKTLNPTTPVDGIQSLRRWELEHV